jgi:predicted Rossmann fold flavoprotein
MDASRYLTDARADDPSASLHLGWLLGETFESIDQALQHLGPKRPLTWLRERLPERLARAICEAHAIDADVPGSQFPREARRALAHALSAMPVAIQGDRGFTHAEATAGGVPLDEIDVKTMQSKLCPNLYIVGELLDVDGRIGGFNFQWAWASGHVAGISIARATHTE